jgi:hypothetical protein
MTLRQYAKRCETSHQTVSAAIQKGQIVEGYNSKEGKIIVDIADMEWGLDFMQKKVIDRAKKTAKAESSELSDDEIEELANGDDIPQNTRINELIRLDILYKARLGKLKAEKEKGSLVDKDEMYREMFEFGKEIRIAVQAIPDRIIDQLITLDRNAAHKMLSEEINKALEKLASDEQ